MRLFKRRETAAASPPGLLTEEEKRRFRAEGATMGADLKLRWELELAAGLIRTDAHKREQVERQSGRRTTAQYDETPFDAFWAGVMADPAQRKAYLRASIAATEKALAEHGLDEFIERATRQDRLELKR